MKSWLAARAASGMTVHALKLSPATAVFYYAAPMNYIIILFATATIGAGIIIVINPETIFGLLRRKLESLSLHILAVIARVILGIALIMYATESRYPTAISILCWISIVAASGLGIMGRTNFKRLMSWALSVAPSFGRIGGLLAILFGGFLIYAVI